MEGPNYLWIRCRNEQCARYEIHMIASVKQVAENEARVKIVCKRCLKDTTIHTKWANKEN